MPTAENHADQVNFWHSVLKAVRVDPYHITQIPGASGLRHNVIATGIDEAAKRLVVVSDEHDGRAAALVQADIQAAFPNYHVLTIRPAAVSVPKLAQALQTTLGTSILTPEFFQMIKNDQSLLTTLFQPKLEYLGALRNPVSLRILPQILELLQQLARLNIGDFDQITIDDNFSIDLSNVLNYDPLAVDRSTGVCGFPLYDFTLAELQDITSSAFPETVAELLKSRDIFQYFFPGPDQLALGLIDRGIQRAEDIRTEIQHAPELGHPLGPMEIVDLKVSVLDVLDALQDRKLLVEGEFGFDTSEEGKKTRCTVKFKPKEGLISKLIGQFSLKLDLKDIFRIGG